jgi:hypothetical protein
LPLVAEPLEAPTLSISRTLTSLALGATLTFVGYGCGGGDDIETSPDALSSGNGKGPHKPGKGPDAGTPPSTEPSPEPGTDGGTTTPDAGTPTPDAGTPPPDGGTTTPDAGTGTPSDPGTVVDRFGVKQLYPSRTGGEAWWLASDATADARFDPQDPISRNADGSWKMRNDQVRMGVMTSTGYNQDRIASYDPDVLTAQGYMQAANDWKNIEMTAFVKLNAASDLSDNFDLYARGGKHNDSEACEGSSYKAGFHYDGRTRWQKETWHVSYDQKSYLSTTTGLKGRWVGLKAVMRNVLVNGVTAVKLEMWLNDNADGVTWKKVNETTDAGDWGGDSTHCGGARDGMPMTWGGPIATFRWDSATDVDFKWLSVREIQ